MQRQSLHMQIGLRCGCEKPYSCKVMINIKATGSRPAVAASVDAVPVAELASQCSGSRACTCRGDQGTALFSLAKAMMIIRSQVPFGPAPAAVAVPAAAVPVIAVPVAELASRCSSSSRACTCRGDQGAALVVIPGDKPMMVTSAVVAVPAVATPIAERASHCTICTCKGAQGALVVSLQLQSYVIVTAGPSASPAPAAVAVAAFILTHSR